MDLGYEGPIAGGPGAGYFLELSIKNTGPVPITQIFVTIKSVQVPMTFTYLNTTISPNAPLPSYQITTGRQNLSPITLIEDQNTYSMIIQATAANGTIYAYQTTITSHL